MSTLSVWTRRDPFADFDTTFNQLVRRSFGPTSAAFVPAAESRRDGDDAVIALELPGLDATNDVTVEIDRGRLVVKGERRSEHTAQANGRSLREVRYGSFRRSFVLPEHIGSDAVTANYDAGVLSVRVAGLYASPQPTAQRVAVTTETSGSTPADVEATLDGPAEDGGTGEQSADA